MSNLPLLDTGEALLLGDAMLLPTRLKLECPKREPRSATHNFWSEWANKRPAISAIEAAVENMRKQSRI